MDIFSLLIAGLVVFVVFLGGTLPTL